jgi:hypothetical protein
MCEELLQGGYALFQTFLVIGLGIIRRDDRQRPGEHGQHHQPPGQAPPPAEPTIDSVHLLFQGFETGLQLVHGRSSSVIGMVGRHQTQGLPAMPTRGLGAARV